MLVMRGRAGLSACAVLIVLSMVAAGCGRAFARTYEYEEDIHLSLDGSATVYVNASVPALVALRGVDLPLDPAARLDRTAVRAIYDSPLSRVENVSLSRRDGRRYVHLRIDVPDIRQLGSVPAFAWASYRMEARGPLFVYQQQLGAAAGREAGNAGWRGDELIAVRLHLPSRVPFHNQPQHEIQRGNIIVWEQPLAARVAGEPLDIEVHMEQDSILFKTLGLFGLMIVLVAITFAVAIWWVMRQGKEQKADSEA